MGDIFTLSKSCCQDFEDLLENLGQADADHLLQLPPTSIESQFGKFRVWCGNLGALQPGFASLDYRLRESRIMQANVTELLQQLDTSLCESNAVVTGRRLPFEDQSASSDSETCTTDESENEDDVALPQELVMRLSSIKYVLSDLYRLGHKIRDPKLRPTSNRAVFLKAEDPETGIELFEQFAVLDKMHVEEVFRDLRQAAEDPITAQNDLSQRLATANTLRRKYFRYWERHAQKLAQSYLEPNDPRGPQRACEAGLQVASQSRSQDVAEEDKKAQPISGPTRDDGRTYLSKTDATPYDASRDDETERATVVSFASTALDADGKGIELPGPPADALKGESFTCPYCLVLCPAKQGHGKVWKAHVLHDLQPYVCTYEECLKPNELYKSRRQWQEHENSAHRKTWRCNKHSQAIFPSPNGLRTHFHHEHEELAESEIEELLPILASAHADDREFCPICLQNCPFPKGLTNHIANHLERIALFALPKNYIDDETDSAVAVAPRESTAGSQAWTDLMSDSHKPAPPITTPQNVKNVVTQLRDAMKRFRGRNGTDGEEPVYLPKSAAEEFWDDEKLRSVLEVYLLEHKLDPSLIKSTCLSAFTLLIFVDRGYLLHTFLDKTNSNILLRDEDFPLHRFPSTWRDLSTARSLFQSFYEIQWAFFPIIFDTATLVNQVIDPACILPIYHEQAILQDDLITVTKIETDLKCTTLGQTTLVRKTYNEVLKDQYDRERKAFESLRGVNSGNILRCYGSYRQLRSDGKITYNLLLEYVSGGDFGSLLASSRPPQTFSQVCDLWTAFIGLLEGLSLLHRSRVLNSDNSSTHVESPGEEHSVADEPSFRVPGGVDYQRIHQDIKPENLLVSRSHSRDYSFELKIADFGFTHTKILGGLDFTQRHGSGTDFHGGQTYGAPERSHHIRPSQHVSGHITTAADIWSLGCVISATAAWVALGKEGHNEYWGMRVEELKTLVAFDGSGHDGCFHNGVGPLTAVSKMHQIITSSVARFDTITPKVIDMVQNHMLCEMDHRYPASDLRKVLNTIIETAKEEYRTSGIPADQQAEEKGTASIPTTKVSHEKLDSDLDSVPSVPNASTEARTDKGPMVMDSYPDYGLRQSDLLDYLQSIFPNHIMDVKVNTGGGQYQLSIPERLTMSQRDRIAEHVRSRPRDSDSE
ncbi:hypothetical protein BGZ61DRAFT_456675 [Ilyonectria robusta]|uniref:uncharacterized protein n=1 Tax=Ilyonectria robusta TaxID=1079257 RepID=UPI001E8E1EDD|nr:uncharacterized protein BGZ61DRAFT_456675 [Ilyonectria robusta]KAH8680424.1 hypothetical protein BGZ61DRAFT_456675 [Ilyonectria robusta]